MFSRRRDKRYQNFLSTLRKSQLLPTDQLEERLASFDSAGNDREKVEAFIAFMIANGDLTQWQCDKLREGKFKGFFLVDLVLPPVLRDCVFVDHHSSEGLVANFVVQNRKTKERMLVAVTAPAATEDRQPRIQLIEDWEE